MAAPDRLRQEGDARANLVQILGSADAAGLPLPSGETRMCRILELGSNCVVLNGSPRNGGAAQQVCEINDTDDTPSHFIRPLRSSTIIARRTKLRSILKVVTLSALLAVVSTACQAQVFVAVLDGLTEFPPNASPATGNARVTINKGAHTMRVEAIFSGLLAGITASHIHGPTAVALTGVASVATAVPTFPGFPSGVTSGSYDATFDMTLASSYRAGFITSSGGTTALAEAVLFSAIEDGKAYLNIHTSLYPGGEIRGFLVPVPEPGTIAFLGGLGAFSAMALLRRRRR